MFACFCRSLFLSLTHSPKEYCFFFILCMVCVCVCWAKHFHIDKLLKTLFRFGILPMANQHQPVFEIEIDLWVCCIIILSFIRVCLCIALYIHTYVSCINFEYIYACFIRSHVYNMKIRPMKIAASRNCVFRSHSPYCLLF